MPLVQQATIFDDPQWIYEIKYDGLRAVALGEHESCRFMSRKSQKSQKQSYCAIHVGTSAWRTIAARVGRCRYATSRVDTSPHEKWRSRTVPMSPEVDRVFTELWQERRLDTQRVFLYKGRPVRDVKTVFDKACRRAGRTNLRLHDLRHTASTNLRRAGVDATTAMKIVGHKSERMHRRYNTVEPEDLRRAVSQLAAYHANTVITPVTLAIGTKSVSPCLSSMRP